MAKKELIQIESTISGNPKLISVEVNPKVSEFIMEKVTKVFDPSKKVPDSRRFILKKNQNLELIEDEKPISKDILDERQNIVFILESPHSEEYDENFNPIFPAQGSTGRNFHLYGIDHPEADKPRIGILKNEAFPQGEFNIILANPIPYQTSLHIIHGQPLKSTFKTLRDDVWITLWQQEPCLKNDFERRLQSYNPVLIINSCTGKASEYITSFLKDKFPTSKKYKMPHPSGWTWYRDIKELK